MSRPSAASPSPNDILGLLDADELADLAKQVGVAGGAADGFLTLSPARLLFEIAKLRLPFILMMNDVAAMLGHLEASVEGNIRFIVLPDLASDIDLDFGPQLRRAVATALSRSFLTEHSQAIYKRLSDLERQVRSICQRVKPMPVDRKDQIGELLDQRAELLDGFDPAGAFRDRWLAENRFTHIDYEYNPTDLERLRSVSDAGAQLETLTNKLLAEHQDLSALASGLEEGVGWVSGTLRHKARSGPISRGFPHTRRSAEDCHFADVQRAIENLREAVLAASEYADAMDDLYDFLNLQIWRQRWRVYELWVMARMVRALIEVGATIVDKSRVLSGTWQLKYTKDSSPILGLDLNGQRIDLYYQLYQERGPTGDMPDLALRINGGRFIAIVDPKHGYSYSRKELSDTCERYADSFQPFFSCVCNYFPVRQTEQVRHDPLSLVLYGFSPDASVTTAQFESALINSLVLAFRDLGLGLQRRAGLIVLFDVSSSASGVRSVLVGAFKREVARMDVKPRADSRALIFSTQIDREGTLDELVSEVLLEGRFNGGTDLGSALRAAVVRLATLPPPTELWLFTDGEGCGDLGDLGSELANTEARFVIFEAGHSALRDLAQSIGGKHVQL